MSHNLYDVISEGNITILSEADPLGLVVFPCLRKWFAGVSCDESVDELLSILQDVDRSSPVVNNSRFCLVSLNAHLNTQL